jgi:hypothetical protein
MIQPFGDPAIRARSTANPFGGYLNSARLVDSAALKPAGDKSLGEYDDNRDKDK